MANIPMSRSWSFTCYDAPWNSTGWPYNGLPVGITYMCGQVLNFGDSASATTGLQPAYFSGFLQTTNLTSANQVDALLGVLYEPRYWPVYPVGITSAIASTATKGQQFSLDGTGGVWKEMGTLALF